MQKTFKIDPTLRITLIYLLIGVCWIFFSDQLVLYIFGDDLAQMSNFQLGKGIFYVLVTGLLLYSLIKRLHDSLKKNQQEISLLFTNPDLGIVKLNEGGYFTYASANILKITGYKREEILGDHILNFTTEERIEQDTADLEHLQSISANEGFIFTKHLRGKDGKEIVIKTYGIVTSSSKSKEKTYVAAFQNITAQYEYLQALKAQNIQLQELAADQSHLVRAPLARIMGLIDLLQNFDIDRNERSEMLAHLKTSSEELDQAIKNISKKMNQDLSSNS
ncbi:PAS domain S-box protein [Algoriphagus halophytocola]|uniref:histidine kinase n=1 Tax=Algoriphagus halophytocola TaxID=2991499 RepID=A0ABY6MJ61_9BACT|nr:MULTISPECIES: PAS domain S-box protein [unclassified Algoriphagus]UZD23065.1 PAS domain S-box protein [Algoriphagus sp. TR-M5]WBL44357.1 PAS domain S-box protein [Algoriphagus sp. TR-M9]